MGHASPTPARATPRTVEIETTDFEVNDLLVTRVEGYEALSELYRFEITLRPRDAGNATVHDPQAMVGGDVRLHFYAEDGSLVRTVSGIVSRARAFADGAARATSATSADGTSAGVSGKSTVLYRIELTPRLSRLGLIHTQEIFMDMTVPEIIKQKIDRLALDHVVFRTSGDYPKREFVVQYKESDLAFVQRLAEHVGLAFHFETRSSATDPESEVVVFSDQMAVLPDHLEAVVELVPREEQRPAIHELSLDCCEEPSLFAVQDYNYRNPRLDLGVVHELEDGVGGVVEYGSHHKTPEEAQALARVRAEASLAKRRVVRGKGTLGWFCAGARLSLAHDPFTGQPSELAITRVHHVLVPPVQDADSADVGYENEFSATGTATPYRPPRITPKPRIHGVLSAIVQADPLSTSNEAKIDDEGRYVVQFHFDTAEREATRTSRPVRMAQPFAGPQQGMHFPLLPDTEVLIAFIDGDPDRPLIIGALSNPLTPSHVTAADAHMHRIQSRHGLTVEFGKLVRE